MQRSQAKCSICAYHRYEDEREITEILQSIGYKTSISKGFLTSPELSDIWEYVDLRRGMIYGEK